MLSLLFLVKFYIVKMERDNVVDFSSRLSKDELSKEQEDYWWKVLEDCERGAEYARRMLKLGKYSVEKGVE